MKSTARNARQAAQDGKDNDPILVWQADTRTMNPTVPQALIDQHLADDPARAGAEWLAPPPQPSLAVMVAQSMAPSYDPRFSADWSAAQKADNVRRAANEARWAADEAARHAESRRKFEASLQR
jgi:hypothetical protein